MKARVWILLFVVLCHAFFGQERYQIRSFFYNSLSGAVVAASGVLLNKKGEQKFKSVFLKSLGIGFAGGALQYAGKRSVNLMVTKNEIGFGWLSRFLFSAGNSMIENAAENKKWWSRFHIDLAFVRVETDFINFRPKLFLLPAQSGAFVFATFFGRADWRLSLRSSTFIFTTPRIAYAPYLIGSASGNHFILNDTLGRSRFFHEIVAHETIHAFQFSEFSALSAWVKRPVEKWKTQIPFIRKASAYVHGDLNYPAMLFNYFIIQGGFSRTYYCRNFLENEAEVLSTGRFSCPACACN